MGKIVSLLTLMLFISIISWSQEKISGAVKDKNGNPIPFATVNIKGTKNSVAADAAGNFSISVKPNTRLVVTAIGYSSSEVDATDNVIAVLESSNQALNEVVVTTAFGIKQQERTTPYSAQVIKAADLNIIPQTNLNDALAGKVAGVQFRSQSGTKLNSQSFAR